MALSDRRARQSVCNPFRVRAKPSRWRRSDHRKRPTKEGFTRNSTSTTSGLMTPPPRAIRTGKRFWRADAIRHVRGCQPTNDRNDRRGPTPQERLTSTPGYGPTWFGRPSTLCPFEGERLPTDRAEPRVRAWTATVALRRRQRLECPLRAETCPAGAAPRPSPRRFAAPRLGYQALPFHHRAEPEGAVPVVSSEWIPGRLLSELEIVDVDAEPPAETGADRDDDDALGSHRREPQAPDKIG